ncbi:glycoside hydrolase [Auriculariales sp. MPI-PUGE-AT-0066]|nr:glycoside hydrolase [Auriculariales sp. MPI-PUGE-AT-0066]
MVAALSAAVAVVVLGLPLAAVGFDLTRYDNVAAYWGQNSYGAANPNDAANWQKSLDFYCNLGTMDMFPISFVTVANSTGGLPQIDLSNICNVPAGNPYFPGTQLLNCQFMASQITTCQSKGKALTISLGGATGLVSFSSDAQASAFADTIWNLFLGGSSSTRPFGAAVLDGVDIGGNAYLISFVNRIRTLSNGASKKYYVTAAPQCPFPDGNLGTTIDGAAFDALFVQHYNNACGVSAANSTAFNAGTWMYFAQKRSKNPNMKVFIGAPGSPSGGGGYISAAALSDLATSLRKKFPSFGGVMYWDASQAYNNARFDSAIKNSLTAAGGTGFTYPACSAPAYVSGTSYTQGSQVTYDGYIWQARWWASSVPNANIADTGEWQAISACGGTTTTTSTTSSTSSTTSRTTTTSSSSSSSSSTTTTSSSSTATPTSGSCAGVAAWSSAIAYTGGQQVTYNGHLWTAKWWTQADTPGGAAGVWTDNGACTARLSSRLYGRRAGRITN